jgi:hypothetical protein
MKKLIAVLLVVSLAVPALALVETGQVQYTGGSIATVAVGTMGKFDLNKAEAVVFQSGQSSITIPYANITKFHYEEKLARHLGVVATIAVVMVKHRQRRHFIEISYKDANNTEQTAMFEIAKTDVDSTKATIEARTPQLRCARKCSQ